MSGIVSFEDKIGISYETWLSVWNWEKNQNLFKIDMSCTITFVHFTYSYILLGDTDGTVVMCDASAFNIPAFVANSTKVVVVPFELPIYEDINTVASTLLFPRYPHF